MAAGPAVKKLRQEYPEQVRLVMKHFPYQSRDNSRLAAEAALAAGEQSKYWEMHDQLIEQSPFLDRDNLLRLARELGLDLDRFARALESGQHETQIREDEQLAEKLGLFATPTFFINGRRVVGNRPYEYLADVVEEELQGAKK